MGQTQTGNRFIWDSFQTDADTIQITWLPQYSCNMTSRGYFYLEGSNRDWWLEMMAIYCRPQEQARCGIELYKTLFSTIYVYEWFIFKKYFEICSIIFPWGSWGIEMQLKMQVCEPCCSDGGVWGLWFVREGLGSHSEEVSSFLNWRSADISSLPLYLQVGDPRQTSPTPSGFFKTWLDEQIKQTNRRKHHHLVTSMENFQSYKF